MKMHVLPGDALADDFRATGIDGEIIVCRECLVDGVVKAESLEDLWQVRARFIGETYDEEKEKYFSGVVAEFEKLKNLAVRDAEINLWFEYELFCQVNMWFCLYFLRDSEAKIFRVAPTVRAGSEIWKGFGGLTSDELQKCFVDRIEFTKEEIWLGADLWRAFQNSDYETLESLSVAEASCFPYLREVCRAEIEKNARPRAVLEKIMADGKTEFAEIFPEFSARAGVYGFGDAQVRRIFAQLSTKN